MKTYKVTIMMRDRMQYSVTFTNDQCPKIDLSGEFLDINAAEFNSHIRCSEITLAEVKEEIVNKQPVHC